MEPEQRLIYFFIWLYGSGVQSRHAMRATYLEVAGSVCNGGYAPAEWARAFPEREGNPGRARPQNLWGEWHDNGVFIPRHPLRTEALDAVFKKDPSQRPFVEKAIAAFLSPGRRGPA